ncbi:hypothetical protein HPB49_018325 [Dermacentor silvarum]|uniref:Uncharacterized protein n=1 Tax=Dermacentor silvarum TaxID=543639 RepID=A0ACB8E242_DERSI|nr:hypothetical protein HPB49_018325 [Dermacentor silvarum]
MEVHVGQQTLFQKKQQLTPPFPARNSQVNLGVRKENSTWPEVGERRPFPGRDIIVQPARAPDLSVPGLFLWGFLKDRVFQRHIMSIQELKQPIGDEVAAIDEDLRRHVYDNFKKRLQQCIDVNGGPSA